MHGDKADLKTIELGKLIYWLRQYLDIHRMIGLNADLLKKKEAGGTYWGVNYRMALDAIAVTVCKIFERETMGYERNSIPGIIAELEGKKLAGARAACVRRYGEKYKIRTSGTQPAATFCAVVSAFKDAHSKSFQRLKDYRNKIGSHSEHGFRGEDLPSHDEFETIFEFANHFYRTAHELDDVHGALMTKHAEMGLVPVFKKLGIENPTRNFPD